MNKENSIFINLFTFLSLIAIALFLVLVLTSSASTNNISDITYRTTNYANDNSKNFASQKPDLLYSYNSYDGNDPSTATHYKDTIVIAETDDLIQIKTVYDDFTEYDELFSTDGSFKRLGRSYVNTRESLIHNQKNIPSNNIYEENSEAVIISDPIRLGAKWEVSEGINSEITSLNAVVELPFGNFDALEVTTTLQDGSYRKDYFVKYIGLVKSEIFNINSPKKTIYLDKMTDDSITSMSYIFNYDRYSNKIYSEKINIVIKTNPTYSEILENMLKFELVAITEQLISDDTYIKSVSIDRQSDTAHINFTSNLLKNTNYTPDEEQLVVTSIADVVGNFYSVHNVEITANGSSDFGVNGNYSNPIHVDLLD